jgi:Predicted membrane protein
MCQVVVNPHALVFSDFAKAFCSGSDTRPCKLQLSEEREGRFRFVARFANGVLQLVRLRLATENYSLSCMARLKRYFGLLKATFKSWSEHKAPRLGAALAFYTIFAIAPLFVIVLAIVSFFFGEVAAREQLFTELRQLVGEEGGRALESVVVAGKDSGLATRATIIAVGTLFIGATGVFVQLQDSLNTVWNLRGKSGRPIRRFVRIRLVSFAMVLAIGFLLLVSLVISAALVALGKYLNEWIPGQEVFWQVVNFVISIGVVTLLFAMIFKIMPDAHIAWHDVWIGALLTAVLFAFGKWLLGLYLGRSSVASVYGAAGSLVVILMWVYYSAQILLFGAEFTRLYAIECGAKVRAEEGMEFVTLQETKGPDTAVPSHQAKT